MNKIKYWYVGGDIHGDWRPIRNWIVNELKTPKDESALILLGDVGANYFANKRDQEFKQQLNKLGIHIFCLRGNHEMRVSDVPNQSRRFNFYWHKAIDGFAYVEINYPYIHYLLDDGGLYNIQGKRILAIPGAYSVDKNYRLMKGWSWFPDEQLNFEEQERLKIVAHDIDFDYVLAHTCPFSWEPYIKDLFMNGLDQSQIDKTTEKFIDELLDDCSYKHFYFGHFHNDRNIPEVNATMLYRKIIPLGEYINE